MDCWPRFSRHFSGDAGGSGVYPLQFAFHSQPTLNDVEYRGVLKSGDHLSLKLLQCRISALIGLA